MMRDGPPAFVFLFRASHWLGWICLCAVLAAVAVAQAPPRPFELSPARPVTEEEPITPVPQPPAADPLKLALGERLFNDPRLSADGKLSCASCHDIRTNGTNRRTRRGPFDALTVFNASLNYRMNWEGNFRSLSAQAVSS